MPTYCFHCPQCQHREEALLPMAGADFYRCTNCNAVSERDRKSEVQGTIPPRPTIADLGPAREESMDKLVSSGAFSLYKDADARGLLKVIYD